MSHVRTQIRSRVVTKVTSLTTTAARVYESRVYPISSAKMPGLCVYMKNEKGVWDDGLKQVKEVEIVIDAYVEGTSYDSNCDKIQAEIETALYGDYNATTDRYLNGLALELRYQQAESQYFGDAAKPYGILRMIYTAQYCTASGAPETAL